MDACGFFGLSGTIAEADLREAVRHAATTERKHWFDAEGKAIDEQVDTQFGHLVRYWLASKAGIWPTTLTFMQEKAIDGSVSYGALATGGPSDSDFETVRDGLVLSAPDADNPSNLNELVES